MVVGRVLEAGNRASFELSEGVKALGMLVDGAAVINAPAFFEGM